jgi:hypothetical protein
MSVYSQQRIYHYVFFFESIGVVNNIYTIVVWRDIFVEVLIIWIPRFFYGIMSLLWDYIFSFWGILFHLVILFNLWEW